MNNSHCCDQMKAQLELGCLDHDPFSCPDTLVYYEEKFDEYGLIVPDGGQSYITINFCPWCGKKLPVSRKNTWFDELEKLGYDDPLGQEIPEQFKTSAWRKDIF